MQPIASPIKLRLPLGARNLEDDEIPVSTSLSTKSLSSSNNALPRRFSRKKKKFSNKRPMMVTERLKPKSTWQLLPRNVRKFLTTREKQVLPTAASLELERSLLEAFENATIASEEGESNSTISALQEHPYIIAAAQQLWYILSPSNSTMIGLKAFSIFCRKVALLVTGISNENSHVSNVTSQSTMGLKCIFKQFVRALISIIIECAPLYKRVVDYVEWTHRLMELLVVDTGEAIVKFRSDEEISRCTLVPVAQWSATESSHILDSLHAEEGEVDEVEIKPDPEEGFLPKAKLSYRTKMCDLYEKYPYKTGENPNIRWQSMRTWQLRELKLAKQEKLRWLEQQDSMASGVYVGEGVTDSANSALPSHWDESTDFSSNSRVSVPGKPSEKMSDKASISVIGDKKAMTNYKYQAVIPASGRTTSKVTENLKGQMREFDLTDTPNFSTYTSFNGLSRLALSHYKILADGTKLASKHNDISFDRALQERKLAKRDYEYTTNLEPLPDGHSIMEEFAQYVEPMQMTNDLRKRNPSRAYKISQLGHLSCLKLGTPLPLVKFPYTRVRKSKPKQKAQKIQVKHKYVFKGSPWTSNGSKLPTSTSPSTYTNNEPDEAVKEMMYIKNALECEARAKIRRREIIEAQIAAGY